MSESLELVVPTTGELISLDDPQQCAYALLEIRNLEQRLRDLKSDLRAAMVEHSRVAGTKTLHFKGMVASVSTPTTILWDHEILSELLEAGLPEDRFNELVTMEVTYKVNQSVAKSIAGSNPDYAEIIQRAEQRITKEPNVTVKTG